MIRIYPSFPFNCKTIIATSRGLARAHAMLGTRARQERRQNTSAGEHRRTNMKIPPSTVPVECILRVVHFTPSRQLAQEPGCRHWRTCILPFRPIIAAPCSRFKAKRAFFPIFLLGSPKYAFCEPSATPRLFAWGSGALPYASEGARLPRAPVCTRPAFPTQ